MNADYRSSSTDGKNAAVSNKPCNDSVVITYSCIDKTFRYLSDMSCFPADFDCRPLWQIMDEDNIASDGSIVRLRSCIEELCEADTVRAKGTQLSLKISGGAWLRWNAEFISVAPGKEILITITNTGVFSPFTDELTQLMTGKAFFREASRILLRNPDKAADGGYAIVYFDIVRFKAVNAIFGREKGDELLVYISDTIMNMMGENGFACRMGADKFIIFMDNHVISPEDLLDNLSDALLCCGLPLQIIFNAGIYVTSADNAPATVIIDRAILAMDSIKGNYNSRYEYYNDELLKDMLEEQEIVGMMAAALADKQFVVYYQPQYNHSNGMLIGAEALVRWNHPEKGMISPVTFIPIFERNRFITNLDLYVFEEACIFLRKCIDNNYTVIPVSTNFSRYDIFSPNFVENLESIRHKYDIPVEYLHLELTESSVISGSRSTNDIIDKLHKCGYIVEMDDFGSGYSSLNVLKDIELDMIKLDMRFLSTESENNKGGTIISSIVRMAKWLNLPVIAEGVENVEQADFLRSIGCDYIQGYLYSKPLPEDKFIEHISGCSVGVAVPQLNLIETLNAHDFWDPESLETLIFNNYVGGAAIFEYRNGTVEVLRVNQKYLMEISMNFTEKEFIQSDPMAVFDEENKKIYLDMLQRAIETCEEQECETWRTLKSKGCGEDRICIRSTVRVIGKSGIGHLFYAMIRNITAEKNYYRNSENNEKRFKVASEQINIYYWEYDIATKEMRPCFRCMRDLGLPPLIKNHPDLVIKKQIFPPEVAGLYRDWHRQVAEGVPYLEAIMPLTPDRVPFRVRYTTEFNEEGKPVKAYGSAALIV